MMMMMNNHSFEAAAVGLAIHISISKCLDPVGAINNDLSHHPDYDSDIEGSGASSHASELIDLQKKMVAVTDRHQGKAWAFHGNITTELGQLHTSSDPGKDKGPFLKLCALLLGHWIAHCKQLPLKFTNKFNHFCIFCNLTSLLLPVPEPNESQNSRSEISAEPDNGSDCSPRIMPA